MEITITEDQFVKAMRDAVQERGPDFVYPQGEPGWGRYDEWTEEYSAECLYVRDDADEPACLIGTALHKAGVPLELLRAHEGKNGKYVVQVYGLPERVAKAAYLAQAEQDTCSTWGAALNRFFEALDRN